MGDWRNLMNEPHFFKAGARYHVLSWMGFNPKVPHMDGTSIIVCSEPTCEFNGRAAHQLEEQGYDITKILPFAAALRKSQGER